MTPLIQTPLVRIVRCPNDEIRTIPRLYRCHYTAAHMKDTRHIIVVKSDFSNDAHCYAAVLENSESDFKL